mmetsp:Transcript_27650/g.38984  ORF Transcript_27650/g.38984 Transcript_27650/m.38984 type:complete len:508 (+) Transcript_27650:21-1544(+)
MLSSVAWVPKGASKAVPKREPLDLALQDPANEDDMDEDAMVEEALNQGFDEEEEGENDEKTSENQKEENMQPEEELDEDARIVKQYNLDDYDQEEDNVGKRLLTAGLQEIVNVSNQEDPYLNDKIAEDDDLSDIEDLTIRPTDCVLVGVHSEEDVNHLDVYIYEEQEDNLYVHHDVLLGAFPLCVEWVACNPKSSSISDTTNNNTTAPSTGSFAAVGTFEPCIEIWDLDVLDAVEPMATLGGAKQETTSKLKLKKKFKKKIPTSFLPGSHESAVMGLSWNKLAGQYLASCSADTTVKVWDLTTQQCGQTFNHHRDKVQSLQWHPTEASVLCAGSYDRTCSVFDVRYPNAIKLTSKLPADTEHLQWHPTDAAQFYVSTENGNLLLFDMRSLQKPVWTLSAHSKPCSSFSINPQVASLLVTASIDKTVKFWDISGSAPACIHTSKTASSIFTVGFCKDSPLLLAVGGEGEGSSMDDEAQSDDKRLAVWNISNITSIAQKYNLKPTVASQ